MKGNVFKCGANRYVQVPTAICYEKGLSGKALGYYVKILSLPQGFHFTVEGFSKLLRDGRDAVRTGLAELEAGGWLVRAQRRSDDGQYCSETLWITLDEPGLSDELAEVLARHHYEITSKAEVSRAAPSIHLDLGAVEAALADEDARRHGELVAWSSWRFDPEARAVIMRYRKEQAARGGNGVFHNTDKPSSEPMSENPPPVATCEEWREVENMGKPGKWKTAQACEGTREGLRGPRSRPMSGFPISAATGENVPPPTGNASSRPMAGFPTSEKPPSNNYLPISCHSLIPTFNKPGVGPGMQEEVVAPAGPAAPPVPPGKAASPGSATWRGAPGSAATGEPKGGAGCRG